MSEKEIKDSFTIESGRICFGHIHNAAYGSQCEVMNFDQSAEPQLSGTVYSSPMRYHVPVRKGLWHVEAYGYSRGYAHGFFVWHDSIKRSEIPELLSTLDKHAPPYEMCAGPEIVKKGIFPIHRYDWDWYDDRGKDLLEGVADAGELAHGYGGPTCFFADRDTFAEQLDYFKEFMPSSHKHLHALKLTPDSENYGVIMCTPGSEYMLARFLLTKNRKEARAFTFYDYYFSQKFRKAWKD